MRERHGPIGCSDEQADLLESATRFCEDKSPISTVRRLLEDEAGYDPEVFAEMAELGWLGVAIPEAYGGVGLDLAEVVPLVEQMGRRLMSGPFVSTTLAGQLLMAAGTDAQKQSLLPALVRGAPATLALAEPEGDFDLAQIGCRAERDGESLKLAGTKCLVLDAPGAHWLIASVMLDSAPALVLLDADQIAQANPVREKVIDETRRSFRLCLDGVRVSESSLLDRASTSNALREIELAGSLLSAADMCGAGDSCVAYTVSYLNTRKQFGRLIGSYQALKHPTVDAHVRMEQSRSHVYAAAHTFGAGVEGEVAVRMAKAQTGPALAFAADRSIQFHGGFGFTYECDAQLYRRRALWGESQYGDAVHQRRLLADLIL
jgi:acyl-CoA dehydrogenase